MKPIQLHNLLQLAVIFMCSSCGDKSRLETHRNDSAVQTSVPAAKVVQNSNKTTQPDVTSNIQESTESRIKNVSASRARGDIITGLFEMHKLMAQWSPVGLPKDKIIELLGKPTSSSDKAMIYRFDHGEGGWQWVFDIENGLVSKVRKVGLE
jgi:hypothetical protein